MNQVARDIEKRLVSCSPMLITTKEWANGIDLKYVTLVVNYGLPIYLQRDALTVWVGLLEGLKLSTL